MKIQKNISLLNYNTFKIDAKADFLAIIQTPKEFMELINSPTTYQKKIILWWGSNVLFLWDFKWLVIKNEITGKEILEERDNFIKIKVWAGENRNDFVRRTVARNYAWIENLVDIPGSVWASPIQNIWAYWVEAWDCIDSVEWILRENFNDHKKWDTLNIKNCKFAYRDSIFKQELKDKFFVTNVIFKLEKYSPNYKPKLTYWWILNEIQKKWIPESEITLQKIIDIISEIRTSKLPDRNKIWTAWSFFKNPVINKEYFKKLKIQHPDLSGFETEIGIKLAAWQLIQSCNLKGVCNWSVWTYKEHALIVINNGWASGQDVENFAKYIQDCVQNNFGIKIEPEVNYIYWN